VEESFQVVLQGEGIVPSEAKRVVVIVPRMLWNCSTIGELFQSLDFNSGDSLKQPLRNHTKV